MLRFVTLFALMVFLCAAGPLAPAPAVWTAPTFRFHTGETLQNVRLAYVTLGDPANPAVLVLHGTTGSAVSMLTPAFGGQLFGPGQPLDATRYFIVIPDALGAGNSAKPSDGLRAGFPRYDYGDMVEAQYRLVTEGLGLHHLRLVIGNSMGGMHTWLWGEAHPDFMDALVPMASQPTPMAGRNWMMRRMIIDMIRNDPDWHGGNYTIQPPSLHMVNVFFGIATNGGTLGWQAQAPTTAAADKLVDDRLAAPFTADANDVLYEWDASRDYNPAPEIERITAPVLAINSADDERNPPETGLMTDAMRHVKNGRLYLIPASAETRGHGTAGIAKFWAPELQAFLATAPQRGN